MKKTIYLHIGWHKTGTSSIQDFLFLNRKTLEEKGLYYPHTNKLSPMTQNAVLLANSLGEKDKKKIENSNAIWKELSVLLKNNKCSNIILSSENFSLYSGSEIIIFFKKHIKYIENYKFKIIIYIRRSIDFLVSYYAEIQKHPIPFNISLEGFLNKDPRYKEKNICNCMHRIENNVNNIYGYIEVFGKENIILRPFEIAQLKNNDLINDFLNCLNLEKSNEFKELKKNINISGSRETTDLLNNIKDLDEIDEKDRRVLLKKIISQNLSTDTKLIESLSDDLIKKVVDENYAMENKLAKTLLNKNELFLEKYPKCYKENRLKYSGLKLKHILRAVSPLLDIKVKNSVKKRIDKKIMEMEERHAFQKNKESFSYLTIKFLGIFIPSKTIRRKMRNWSKNGFNKL